MLLLSGSWLTIKAREKQRKDGANEKQETDEGNEEEGEEEMTTPRRKNINFGFWKERKRRKEKKMWGKKMNGYKSSSKNKERITKIMKLPIYPQRQL